MNYFQGKNATVIGMVGFAVIIVLLALGLNAKNLPYVGGGVPYQAEFTEVGGLRTGDAVKLAGVNIGTVDKIELRNSKVLVSFTVDSQNDKLEARTGASIRIRTVLGSMYLALQPAGGGKLEAGTTIPTSRTAPPYDIVTAVSELTTTVEELDPEQIGEALRTANEVADKTPESLRGAIDGVSSLSTTIADQDDELSQLLKTANELTGTISSRNTQIAKLLQDGGPLFRALAERRDAIRNVLVSTQQLAREIQALVRDSRADLKPALAQLARVTEVLQRNEKAINAAFDRAPMYFRALNEATGSGPWLTGYLSNICPLLADGLPCS